VRPGWFRTGWELLLGYLWTLVMLAPPVLLLLWLGVVDSGTVSRRPAFPVYGPFYPGGVWAVVTDLGAGAAVVVVATATIARSFLERTGFVIPRWILLTTLGMTGCAPYLGVRLLPIGGTAASLATVVVMRLTARPVPQEGIQYWSLKVFALAFAAALVLLISYGSLHPLRASGGGTWFDGRPMVVLQNAGVADMTLLSASVPARIAGSGAPSRGGGVRGTSVPARHSVSLIVPRSVCGKRAFNLRYRLLGRTWTQPIRVPKVCGF
jgi:hypothetical protein